MEAQLEVLEKIFNPDGKTIEFDIIGKTVQLGNVIDNEGTFKIMNSVPSSGELKLMHPIEQKGNLYRYRRWNLNRQNQADFRS